MLSAVLVAVVVLLSMVTGLNLLLTFGMIRRLRVHSEILRAGRSGAASNADIMLPAGAWPAPFAGATTTAGEPLTRDDLRGVLVGFFAHDCDGCRRQLPEFVTLVRSLGRERVVAVVVDGDADANRATLAALEPVARVVTEPHDGPLQRAFAVRGFPAMGVLDADGRVTGATMAVTHLPAFLPDRLPS
ncbi:TlpA family protein disulfide reductase [Plantactinospora sonchi]|uniref:Thioredoxin-like domain-containing protein n=1 Tax=Plantactinospora sonchi TaxID=1544735 RepID=A0ABU7S0E3_9ACTN